MKLKNETKKIDAYGCVLRQIASASGALRGVWIQVVGDQIQGCISRAALDPQASNKLVKELVEHISKIR